MPITSQDLASFNTFVAGKLTSGTDVSLVDLAREWETERREYKETAAELRECIADMEAGRGRLLSDFAAEMRGKYNMSAGDA